MKIVDLGGYYFNQLAHIAALDQTLWREEAQDFLMRAAQDIRDADELLEMLHEAQRLNAVAVSGLGNDAAFKAAVLAENLPTWKDFTAPPVALDLQRSLARKLYNIEPGRNDFGLIGIGGNACEVGKWLVEKCIAEKVPFAVQITDASFNALVLNHADEAGVKAYAADYLAMSRPVTKHMIAGSGLPDKKTLAADEKKSQLFTHETEDFHRRRMSGEVFYTLTRIPTQKDAEIDEIPYDDYIKLFFESVDQPWDEIGQAQGALIKEFNTASNVRITNDDGTDISFSLVDHDGSHFTFCNSLIAKNVPGSELFSAPRLDSAEGRIVSKGRFSEHGSDIIENLTLEFEKGKLVRFDAEKGLDTLKKILSIDEGTHYLGELAFGTNPHLRQHLTNGLLVEKIGGSFHVALGDCYKYTEYAGVPVKVNNGGKSKLHWDITTMLRGKNGCVYLDGRKVMDNGLWLDPKYDVLNRGWEAISEDKRPDYWKNYYKNKGPAPGG